MTPNMKMHYADKLLERAVMSRDQDVNSVISSEKLDPVTEESLLNVQTMFSEDTKREFGSVVNKSKSKFTGLLLASQLATTESAISNHQELNTFYANKAQANKSSSMRKLTHDFIHDVSESPLRNIHNFLVA